MTLTQMQYFAAVCATLNITHAARQLNLSQPALSASIHSMEQECGVVLFRRRANSLTLTDEGMVLLEEITPLLRHYDRVRKVVEERRFDRKYIRLSFSTIAGGQVCPRLCSRYRNLYPDVQVFSAEMSTEKHYQELEQGHVDLVLTSRPASIPDDVWNEHYGHVEIRNRMPLAFCVNIENPLAARQEVGWQEIAQEPLIIMDDNFSFTRRILREMEDAGFVPQNTVLRTRQLYTVERFIEENAACGFLPEPVALKNQDIVPLRYPFSNPRALYLTWVKSRTQFSAVKNFIRMVKKMYPADNRSL